MRQAEMDATVTDLREAIAEMEAGDQGRPLAEVAEEIRREHNFSSDDV
jgi:hypothetical protein